MDRKEEPMSQLSNKKKLWNSKLIGKLLLTITVADLKQFTLKSKLIIYIEAFIELYNQRNYRQVHRIYKIIKLKKISTLTIENSLNLGVH